MKNKLVRIISLVVAVFLVLGTLPQIPLRVQAASEGEALGTLLEGKTLSILGDSISTYDGVSRGENVPNATIKNNWSYYPALSVTDPSDTWWQQTADALGMKILVNNSWSGSYMLPERYDENSGTGTPGAWVDRCVQLHTDAGETPDMIAIFLGTNDYTQRTSLGIDMGSYEEIVFSTLITGSEGSYTYEEPDTTMEAYAICLHKISQAYPDAEVYCFTLLPTRGSTTQPTELNTDIKELADHFGAKVVDLYSDSGFIAEPAAFNILTDGNALHPGMMGMDAMTSAFVSAILENSKYVPENTTVYNVSYDLDNVMTLNGTAKAALGGAPFTVDLDTYFSYYTLGDVTVTMGDTDITESCYADGKVSIEAVTGDVTITAGAVMDSSMFIDHADYACEHCSAEEALWIEWDGNVDDLALGGHFCLNTDAAISSTVSLDKGQDVVICLHGHDITSNTTRLFRLGEGCKLTIVDCTAHEDENGVYSAGTIYASSSTTSTLKGSVVGVYAGETGGFTMYDGIIDGNGGSNALNKNNTSDNQKGGGLIDMYSNSRINIYGGELRNYTGYRGGAIYARKGLVTIDGAKITNCSADEGGAIYAYETTVNISNTTISGCTSTAWAGACHVNAATLNLDNVQIVDNTSVRATAIYTEGVCTLTVKDSTITGNESTHWGTVYVDGADTSLTVSGNTQIHSNDCGNRNSYGIVLRSDKNAINSYNGPAVLTVKELADTARILVWTEGVYVSDTETVARDYITYPAVVVESGELDPNSITYTNANYDNGIGAAVYLKADGTTAICDAHSYENGVCTICGAADPAAAAHEHTCEHCKGTEWVPFTGVESGENNLASGHYYLTGNTTLDSWIDVRDGQDITLCLNGYMLTGPVKGRLFRIAGGAKVTIVDCGTTGKMIPQYVTDGLLAGIYGDGCEFNIYGGTVQGIANAGKSLIYMNTDSTVNIYGSTLKGNGGTNGGAIYATVGTVNIENATIKNCTATVDGGAIYTAGGAQLNICNTKISGCSATNSAGGNGGAICANNSIVNLDGVTLTGNSARRGGAIRIQNGAELTIKDSTITGNTDTYYAAVTVWDTASSLTVSGNTVINNNTATSSGYDDLATGIIQKENSVLTVKDLGQDAQIVVCAWTDSTVADPAITLSSGTVEPGSITYHKAVASGDGESLVGAVVYDDAGNLLLCTEHSWDAGIADPEATCKEEGVKIFTCSTCGETKTETIPVDENAHSYESVVTAPICTEGGYTTHTCSGCGDTYVDTETEATGHSFESGSCTVCGEADPGYEEPAPELFNLEGITMTLGNRLDMNFVIDTAKLEGDGHYAVIVKSYADGKTTKVTVDQADWENFDGADWYYFTFSGVAAKEMTDTITVNVYNADGEQVTYEWVDSVEAYCIRMLPQAQSEEEATLYVDMLNYGAAAQSYFGYKTDDLANADLTAEQQAKATQSVSMENKLSSGTGYVGSALTLESCIQLDIVFDGSQIEGAATAVATYTDHYGAAQRVEYEKFGEYAAGMPMISLTGMSVADCSQMVTLSVYDAEGNVLSTVEDSVESYVARMTESDPLFETIMKFATSSYNYFH